MTMNFALSLVQIRQAVLMILGGESLGSVVRALKINAELLSQGLTTVGYFEKGRFIFEPNNIVQLSYFELESLKKLGAWEFDDGRVMASVRLAGSMRVADAVE
jgi:hypothetical protein